MSRTTYLAIPFRLRQAVAEAEQHASDIKRHAGSPAAWRDPQGAYEWWIDTFGASEQEFEEMADALAEAYKNTRPWQRKERKRIMHKYIRVKAILTRGNGLTTVWS